MPMIAKEHGSEVSIEKFCLILQETKAGKAIDLDRCRPNYLKKNGMVG